MRKLNLMVFLFIFTLFTNISYAVIWDFNDENQIDDWITIVGTVEIDEDALKISDPAAEGQTLTGDFNWTDYTIQCKARLTEPGGFNNICIVFRASEDAGNEYIFMLEGGRQQGEWWKKIAGAYTEIQVDPLEIDLEDWFTFRVVIEGNSFKAYYNGEFVSEIEDDDLSNGMVGLRVYGCTSHADDFDVNGPNIPLTSVDIKGKLSTTWGELKQF